VQVTRPLQAILRSHPFFQSLSDGDLSTIASALVMRQFRRGQTLFSRGEAGNGLYVIIAGLIRLSVISREGRELTLRLAGAGEIIGEIAAIDRGPRSTDGVALLPSETLELPHDAFLTAIDRLPPLRHAVLQQLCLRLRATTEQLEGFALQPLEARLARFLIGLAQQPAADRDGDSSAFELAANQREIATMVGASRPRLNQLLVRWMESGIVSRKGRRVICRLSTLESIARMGAE
jgi:CRP-like cAMP-binding protein